MLEERKARVILKARKYRVKDERMIGKNKLLVASRRKKKIVVLCTHPTSGTIGIKILKNLKPVMEEEGAEKGMIITQGSYSFAAKNFGRKFDIELIPPTLPAFDLTEHELVSKHRILSPTEVKKLLEKYRIEAYQMPYIKKDDPVAILLGATPGEVLEIVRDSPTAKKFTTYRYVVE